MIISHMTCFCRTGIKFEQCNKINIKTYDIDGASVTHVDKQN